jgi:hypothetical protein
VCTLSSERQRRQPSAAGFSDSAKVPGDSMWDEWLEMVASAGTALLVKVIGVSTIRPVTPLTEKRMSAREFELHESIIGTPRLLASETANLIRRWGSDSAQQVKYKRFQTVYRLCFEEHETMKHTPFTLIVFLFRTLFQPLFSLKCISHHSFFQFCLH